MAANKPDIDWNAIARRYAAGDSLRTIARDCTQAGQPISHQAIANKARREGWIKGALTRSMPGQARRQTAATLVNGGEVDKATAQGVLDRVMAGASQIMAGRACGVDPDTLRAWRKANPDFARALDAAEGHTLAGDEEGFTKAREDGDWRAGLTRLERHPWTRERWAPVAASRGQVGPAVIVQFNWHRDEPPPDMVVAHKPVADGPLIEGERAKDD